MDPLWLRARSELRSTWRATVLLALLFAIGGGCALTALAGARRTQTAMPRFVAYNRPEDVSLFFPPSPEIAARVLALPEVAQTLRTPFLMVSTDPSKFGSTAVFGAADAIALRSAERPMVLHGRLAAPGRADEAVVNDAAVRQAHLHVGSRVRLYAFSRAQIQQISGNGIVGTKAPAGPHLSVRVVGVVRQPNDIAVVPIHQDVIYAETGSVYTTPAFVRLYARTLGIPFEALPGNEIARVRLRNGTANLGAFSRDVARVARGQVQVLPGSDVRTAAASVQRGVAVETLALLIFAALAALVTVLLVTLNIARMLRTDARDHAQLAALGMTRRQRLAVAFVRPALIALIGAVLAVAFAIGASPLTPIGLARQAELHPGIEVNIAVLAAGLGALLLGLLGSAVVAALMATKDPTPGRPARRRRLGSPARRSFGPAALGPAATLGVSSAWSTTDAGGGARRVAIVAFTVATAAVTAAATFGTSLAHLAASPRQQGWTFDVVVGNSNDQTDQVARDAPFLERNPYVGGFSAIASPPDTPTIDGHAIGIAGVDQTKGSVGPVVLEGRFVRAVDEIVLGRASLDALHKRVGDRVDVVAGPRHVSMRVTGVILGLSAGSIFNARLDEGGGVTLAGLKRLEPQAFVTLFFVRFAAGVDRRAAIASMQRHFGLAMLQRIPAQDVENLVRVDALPWILAALLALLGIATLTHTLLASVRRRRRELATLKALGLARAQLAASVLWQTWTLALVGVVIGIPAGVVVGRWAWQLVANQIGSVQSPAVPITAVTITLPAAMIVATLAALVAAWQAASVRPSAALAQE